MSYDMKPENNVIHSIEFEMGQVLDFRIETPNGSPMFFICWKGERIDNNIDYHHLMSKFHTIKKVLWEVYGWAYCDECNKMEYGVKEYTLEYNVGTKTSRRLCSKWLSGYKERMKRGEIASITEKEGSE